MLLPRADAIRAVCKKYSVSPRLLVVLDFADPQDVSIIIGVRMISLLAAIGGSLDVRVVNAFEDME